MIDQQQTHTFTGDIEIQRQFKAVPRIAAAEIFYTLSGTNPEFTKVVVDGAPVPLSQVSRSSLLQAYTKLRFRS